MNIADIIVRVQFPSFGIDLMKKDFTVHYAPTPEEFEKVIDANPQTRALVTNGTIGVKGEQLRRLPNLEIVHTQGVGFENVDIETVKAMGLKLVTGKGVNAFSVADHAMALLLAAARHITWADRRVREGKWTESRQPRAAAWKKRLGIMGLGEIGSMIANRARGFEMEIGYHNRNPRVDVGHTYFPSVLELARNSDFLVIATPGGPETRGLVGAEVLDALGPDGYLVNIGRGTIVDTDALIAALHDGRIAGAALDVVAGEPEVSPELLAAPNLTITPHMAGRCPESVNEAMLRISNNLKAHFAGEPLISRIL
jgi:lactate dehydrogenase-like 2-hydroxyacid dehydrogenase